jgi:hypothetical protein
VNEVWPVEFLHKICEGPPPADQRGACPLVRDLPWVLASVSGKKATLLEPAGTPSIRKEGPCEFREGLEPGQSHPQFRYAGRIKPCPALFIETELCLMGASMHDADPTISYVIAAHIGSPSTSVNSSTSFLALTTWF